VKPARITTYPQFWHYYLREHAKPATRAWHYLGTSCAILCLAAAMFLRQPWLVLASVIIGYGPAWAGHFVSEHNRPATFRYPLWSLFSDFRMFAAWLSGRLPRELEAAGIATRPDRSKKAGT
jgi:hypothetical protein